MQNNNINVNASHNDNESNIPNDYDHNINSYHHITLAIITVFQTYLHYTTIISNKMRNNQKIIIIIIIIILIRIIKVDEIVLSQQ